MNKIPQQKSRFFNLTHYTSTLLAVWTIIVAGLVSKEYSDIKTYINETTISTAQAHLDKDKSFRFWGTLHGGVYVPVNAQTPPNPYLIGLQDRDLLTPGGQKLTLMNPEYMVRNMNDTFSELYGVSGHITSLKPLRPQNSPDAWEKAALLEFEKGAKVVREIITDENNSSYLRLMEPVFVKQGCLKCHGHQGYKVGDIRGGVGITLPIDKFIKRSNKQLLLHTLSLCVLWFFGCIVISIGSHRLKLRTAELAASNIELQREVTEHKKTEQLLHKESTFTAAIQDTAAALIMVLDTEGKIVRFNQSCEQLSGYTFMEAAGQYFWELLFPEEDKEHFRANFHKSEFLDKYEAPLIAKDGTRRIIDWNNTNFWDPTGKEEYIISTGIDITESMQLQEQLLHAEKLTAVGKLSASIAHEINNPLFGIRNVLERLKEKANLDKANAEFTNLAIQECDRIKNLIIDLQDFNRPTSGIMTTINIHKIIDNMLLLSRKETENKKISLSKDFSPKVGEIRAISDQIKQVLLNLINNALEATPPGGIITISTRRPDPKFITINVSDTGVGIKGKDLKHIFEPFFTTKSTVKGTGLGLSVSYGIIKRHGGEISVKSILGKGTIFTVSLPVGGAAYAIQDNS